MKLMVIMLCLLSERFLIHTIASQRFFWFADYYQYLKKLAARNTLFSNPWFLLALIILPLLLVTGFIYVLFHGIFYGLMGMILSIALFFYCLGPQNVFYPVTHSDSENNNELVGDYFSMVNRQLFSVVFWYIIAGPIAAVAYRLVTLCCDVAPVRIQASKLSDVLEWIPARLTVLLFLLVGDFQRGFKIFLTYSLEKPEFNNQMLRECGLLVVQKDESEEVAMLAAEHLVEYAIIVMMVFIALFTLSSWL